MKNLLVDVLGLYLANGKIKPLRFKYADQLVTVQKILKVEVENIAGNKRVVFTCLHVNNHTRFTYQLKYEIDSFKWYLFY